MPGQRGEATGIAALMEDVDCGAFLGGKSEGYTSGIAGKPAPPPPDPLVFKLDPYARDQYVLGAALGFEEREKRREAVHARAEIDLERDPLDRDR